MTAGLYTVLPSIGEGLGCFATANIPPGTLFLSEKPLFSVLEPRKDVNVVAAFTNLTNSEQERYLALHAVDRKSDGAARVIDIFNSNAWQNGLRTSILLDAARFNHSCVPNATISWSSEPDCVTVRSLVVIKQGEQIYLSYVLPYLDRTSRKLKLSSYGFVCSCQACSSDSTASERRRGRMIALDAKIRIARRQKWKSEVPYQAIELVRLLKEERLVGEVLGLAYHDVALGWMKMERWDMALMSATMELKVAILCYGANSPNVNSTRKLMQELTNKNV